MDYNVPNSYSALLDQMSFENCSKASHNCVIAHCRTDAILQSNRNVIFGYSKKHLSLPTAQVSPLTFFAFFF